MVLFFITGEVVSIPLPCSIISIWSLPFGLLLQQVAEGNSVTHGPFSYSSPSLGSRDIIRNRRESRHSPQHNFSLLTAYDHLIKGESSSMSSHLILKDLLEEPQVCNRMHLILRFCINSLSFRCLCVGVHSMALILHFEPFWYLILYIELKIVCDLNFAVNLHWRKRKTEHNEGFWWKNNLD